MLRKQAFVGTFAFLCTFFAAISAPVSGQSDRDPIAASTPAIPEGEPGIRVPAPNGVVRSTADIMRQQAVTPPHGPRPEHELESPDRENLRQNPDALPIARFPAGPPSRPDQAAIHTPALSFDGATLTDTGAFPPDSMGTVGPNQYMVFVNGRMRSFTKAGTADGVINADPDVFFAPVMTPVAGTVVLNFTSDPQVRYDRFSARWFMSIIDVPCTNATCTTTAPNRWLLAVSDAASNGTITAATTWTLFQFQADPGTNFCDYPSLGLDVNALYVGCNMFSSIGNFLGTNGYVVQKTSALGAGPLVVTAFPNLVSGAAGAGPFAPRGVDNVDATATQGYFVGVDNATFGTIMFRRVSNPGSATPTISANISVAVGTTQFPHPTEHAGNTGGNNGRLDALDDRLFAATIRGGHLWTAHNICVTAAGVAGSCTNTNQNRNAPRWYDFQNLGTTPTVAQSGTVFDSAATRAAALQYWIPSITQTGQGHAVLGFSLAGTPSGATPAFVGRLSGDAAGTMTGPPGAGAVQFGITAAGYNPPTDPGGAAGRRWGDYSFTVVDPLDDMTVWTIQEYNHAANSYAVRVGKLLAPPPATPTCTATPIDFNGGTGNVVINATSTSGSGFYDPGANLPAPALPFTHLTASMAGGTVNSTTFNSPTQVTLNITATTGGLHNVTITNPDGQNVTATGCINVIPAIITHVVTPSVSGGNGTIAPSTPQTVNDGATTSFTLTPNPGFHIDTVGGTCGGSLAGNVFTTAAVIADCTVDASFAIDAHTVTPSVSGGNGTIAPSTPQTINDGATAAFTLTPDPGFRIDTIGGTCGGSLAGNVFTTAPVLVDCTVIASFVLNTHTVTPSVGSGNGTIAPSTPQIVNDGATIGFTLTPDPGFHIDTTGGTCGGSLAGSVFTTNPVVADCTVIASFAAGNPPACGTGSAIEIFATAGTIGPSGYTTLKGAFDAINAGTHQGAITVDVCADTTETASAALSASGTGASSYTTIVVNPAGGGARTVSGAIAAGSPLVELAGADNVTIDGLNSGGNALTLSNTTASATAGTSTIRFINGATGNTVTRTSVLGSSNATAATAGGNILFSTSTVAGGNSNNTIAGNNIGPAGANLMTKGVMGVGTAANPNTGNLVDTNNIFDFFSPTVPSAGVSIQAANNNWTISNNRIYQTAPRTFTALAQRYSGVLVASAGNTFTVSGNTIGFGAADGSGTTTISGSTNEFRGIAFTNSSTTAGAYSTISGNTISGINVTSARNSTSTDLSPFIGIQSGSGATDAPANVIGNTIGSLDGSSTIVVNASSTTVNTSAVQGILDFNFVPGVSNSNNNIGSITINNGGTGTVVGFRGILVASTTGATHTVSNNTIGGTAIGSITDNIVGTTAMYGIQIGSANVVASGNIVRNMVGNSTTVNGVVLSGILSTASTGANTISQNTIHSLSNSSGAASNSIYALYCSFASVAGNLVERNLVHSLSIASTATTSQLVGILPVAGSGTYRNNMVRLGIDAAGNSITPGYVMYGMFEIAGSNNVYDNSVYVGGSGVVSASNTFGLVSNVATGARNYVDNIFWNARSNISGAGKNYAIGLSGLTGAASDYNDLLASGTGGITGVAAGVDQLALADWRAATLQDSNSIAIDPLFVTPTGNAASVDLHVQIASPAIGAGIPIASITDDFDGDPRPLVRTTIGADENPNAPITHIVTPSVGAPSGTITPSTPQTVIDGATTAFTLTPDPGFAIDNVGGSCGGVLAGNVFTTDPVATDCTVVANFIAVVVTHTVTPSVGTPSGTINPSTPQLVGDGATPAFILTPDAGFQIDSVTGTCGGSLVGGVFTTDPVIADCTVIANFTADPLADVQPTDLSFDVSFGGSDSAPLSISNLGGSTLTWAIAEAPGTTQNMRGTALPGSMQPVAMRPVAASTGTETLGLSSLAAGLRGASIDIVDDAQISQMADNTPVSPNGLACGQTGVNTADNSWWRRFYFNEHPGVAPSATINAVTIAVENGPDVPVTVNLYTIPHSVAVDTIPLDQIVLIGSFSGTIGGTLQSLTIPVNAVVADTLGNDLVVEYHIDGAPTPFFPGGNATTQTHPTFISSATCNLTTPVNPASLGFPNFHVIMVVDVSDGPPDACLDPSDVPWIDAAQTSGSVAGGDTDVSTIEVDADGLGAGAYSALLCVTTNDPLHALVEVPVSLTVAESDTPPTVAKAFSPPLVPVNTDSTVTLTLGNPSAAVATLTAPLVDTLPAGLVVASPDNGFSTCANAFVTALPGEGSFSVSTGTEIPANGSCTVSVNVRASSTGDYVNTIGAGALQTTTGGNTQPASATLTVIPPLVAPTLAKTFVPSSVEVGTPSTLTLTLGNSNVLPTTLTQDLIDSFPTGLFLAPNPNESTTCPGGFVNAVGNSDFFSLLAGAEIPAGGCTVTVDVQSDVAGTYVNTIPAGALQTTFGSNAAPATDTLLVTPGPVPPTLAKAFAPDTVTVDTPSTLTLALGNANGEFATLTDVLIDTLPSELFVATPANASTTCPGGSVTANSGTGQVQLSSGASIPAMGTCVVTVDVVSAIPGAYVNTILAGALATTLGSNVTDATDTLIVSPVVISDRIFCDGFDGIACPDFLQPGGFYGVLMTKLAAPAMAVDRRTER